MAHKIGIIAEDSSDIDVIKLLAKKISGRSISTSHFVGKGCGPLKRKTPAWCQSLFTKGCTRILLVHDRDRNVARKLREQLEAILGPVTGNAGVVVIPEEELEAWLLSDVKAIAKALKLRKTPKGVHHPEKIESPKEFLHDTVLKISGKTVNYVNSVHNKMIAEEISIAAISAKCPSFGKFRQFFEN